MSAPPPDADAQNEKLLFKFRVRATEAVQTALMDHDMTHDDLAARLREVGFEINPKTLANRVKRGEFSMAFGLLCLYAAGARSVPVVKPADSLRLPRKPRPSAGSK